MLSTSTNSDVPAGLLLRSNRLAVEIAQPGTIYRRTRFDWTGWISQVTLDEQHTFCVPEDYDPQLGTGGSGLCSEFGIEKCIGYADAQPGQAFPKLGVGLLVRPDTSEYQFFAPYEVERLFPIHIESSHSQATFVVEPLNCRGYAVRQQKTIRVEDNCLSVSYQLDNVGQQPVETHEYVHNFVGIDRHPVGSDYCLRFPYAINYEPLAEPPEQRGAGILEAQGCEMHWKGAPQRSFYCRLLGSQRTDQPQWELRLKSADAGGATGGAIGAGMREFDDFAPARVALWGAAHVISPEIFIDIHLEPGQSLAWTRRFEFFSF